MDVILQTGSQLHAHRLQLYASSPHLQAFPSSRGFCTAAEELGALGSDPCLVLLSNCTVAPDDLLCHIRSTFLRGYIVRVYWCDGISSSRVEFVSHLKTLIAEHQRSGSRLAIPQSLSGRSEHIAGYNEEEEKKDPVRDAEFALIRLGLQETEKERLTAAFGNSCSFIEEENRESKLKVRLQTHPRDLADALVDELTEIDCQLHGFSSSLYAVHTDGTYRYGIGSGNHMYLAPPDREDMAKGYISRASLKLEETMQVLEFPLHQDMIAVDLGASPGAWTQYLSKHIKLVIAVDPAPLHKLLLLPNVIHVNKMAQDATEELVAYREGKGYDLLVCDINRHPVEVAQVVATLLPHLCEGGLLVFTLKFHGRGRDKEMKASEMKRFFKGSLRDMECIWLLANSIYERTFVGRKI